MPFYPSLPSIISSDRTILFLPLLVAVWYQLWCSSRLKYVAKEGGVTFHEKPTDEDNLGSGKKSIIRNETDGSPHSTADTYRPSPRPFVPVLFLFIVHCPQGGSSLAKAFSSSPVGNQENRKGVGLFLFPSSECRMFSSMNMNNAQRCILFRAGVGSVSFSFERIYQKAVR